MKKLTLIIAALVIICVSAIISCTQKAEAKSETSPTIFTQEQTKRGEYLVTSMGCDDCHSPKVFGPHGPEPDMNRRLSGHPADMPLPPVDTTELKNWLLFNPTITAFVGPWGASFAANLTSDATGVGNWSFKQFEKAIREGKYKGLDGGRPILPPMPWPQYKNLNDEDLKAIFAFLKSTKPVENIVPGPIPPDKLK